MRSVMFAGDTRLYDEHEKQEETISDSLMTERDQ